VGLQPFTCWDCGFESHRGHECLSLVSVVCCQVEVSASGRSLVQRSPTECGVSCDREASIMRRPWPTRGCCVIGKKTGLLANREIFSLCGNQRIISVQNGPPLVLVLWLTNSVNAIPTCFFNIYFIF
jgi:hypothetical protein